MKLIIGITVAPRPASTYQKCVESLTGTGVVPILFAEPGCCINRTEYLCIQRPAVETETPFFTHSPTGVFGNFQNWIQTAMDLLEISDDADTIMIAEDDALFAFGIASLLERDLWPSEDCGVVSLYTPNLAQYAGQRGLNKAMVLKGEPDSRRNNLVGALALVFPRHVLEQLVKKHASMDKWGGAHNQRGKGVPPWERKAIDTWIGRELVSMKKTIWHYSPSLVLHWSPLPAGQSNSSLGHDAPRGNSSVRQCREWIGENPGDLCALYPPAKELHVTNLHPSQI